MWDDQGDNRLYSVTSIISSALGKGDALVGHCVKMVAERAYDERAILGAFIRENNRDDALRWLKEARWKKSGPASWRGSQVHKAAEQINKGLKVTGDLEETHYAWVNQYRQFLDDFQPEFTMAEASVWNLTRRYAGTTDGAMIVEGTELIYDIKTTDKGPNHDGSRPPYPEVALQLCAYAHAEYVGLMRREEEYGGRRYYVMNEGYLMEEMPKFENAACLVLSPYDYELRPIRIDETIWDAWLHILEAARWTIETSKRVVGPVIMPSSKKEGAAA